MGLSLSGIAFLTAFALHLATVREKIWNKIGLFYFGTIVAIFVVFILSSLFNGAALADLDGLARLLPLLVLGLTGAIFVFDARVINTKTLSRMAAICLFINYTAWMIMPFGNYEILGEKFQVYNRFAFFNGNPLPYAMALATLIPLNFIHFLKDGIWEKAIKVAAGLLGLTVLAIGTGGRSGLIIAILEFFFLAWLISPSVRKFLLFGSIAALISVLAVSGLYYLKTPKPSHMVRFEKLIEGSFNSEIEFQKRSNRHDNWFAATQAIKQKPILGHGFLNRSEAARPHFLNGSSWTHVHNDVLTSWIAGGVIGAILSLGVILANLALLAGPLRGDKALQFLALCGFANVFVNAMVNVALFYDITSAAMAFSFTLPLMLIQARDQTTARIKR